MLLLVLSALLFGPQSAGALIVHCAASQRGPMEQIAADYERDGLGRIELRYGGSQSLLTNIQVTGQGDLFLPADDSYVEMAREKGLIAEVFPLARMNAVVAVAAGNPKRIATWQDLFRKDVTLAQAEPDVAAIGKLTRNQLRTTNQWDALHTKTIVYKGTVTDVSNAVALGSVDAGIVWDVVVRPSPKLAVVELVELAGIEAHVSLAVLKNSRQPAEATRFAHYVVENDQSRRRFEASGFRWLNPKAR